MRQMIMVGFLQAQNCTNLPSLVAPSGIARPISCRAEYYQEIGRVLEAREVPSGLFRRPPGDAGPVRRRPRASRPARHPLREDGRHTVLTSWAWRPSVSASALPIRPATTSRSSGARIRHAGLMTNGRAAWNVVTSLNDGEALNMGRDDVLEHDLRYDRADEFMEVVLGHWDAWEDDAIVADKASGLFADPAKVHRLDHEGALLPVARAIHRAALAAGPSGHHSGRPERPRPALRRTLGRGDLRRLSKRATSVGATMPRSRPRLAHCRPRPRADDNYAIRSPPLWRDQSRGGRQVARKSKSCRSRSMPWRCCPKAQFRFRGEGDGRAAHRRRACAMSGLLGIRDGVLHASGKRIRRYAILSGSTAEGGYTTQSSAAPRRSPTSSRRGLPRSPATDLSRPPMFLAPMRISCASSSPNCSRGAYSARHSPGSRCAKIWGCRYRRSALGVAQRRRPLKAKLKRPTLSTICAGNSGRLLLSK